MLIDITLPSSIFICHSLYFYYWTTGNFPSYHTSSSGVSSHILLRDGRYFNFFSLESVLTVYICFLHILGIITHIISSFSLINKLSFNGVIADHPFVRTVPTLLRFRRTLGSIISWLIYLTSFRLIINLKNSNILKFI